MKLKVKQLREFVEKLPPEADEYTLEYGHVTEIEGDELRKLVAPIHEIAGSSDNGIVVFFTEIDVLDEL